MCTTCGCSDVTHDHGQGEDHRHLQGESGVKYRGRAGQGARRVSVVEDLLAVNDSHAARNRHRLAHLGVFAVNLMSSPGAGKTTLLEQTIRLLQGRLPMAVIEGDQQTVRDAERIRAAGAPSVQINTGTGCHLDALGVGEAMSELAPAAGSLLFIENVGNLVCPAGFDLGESRRVVVLSVTEGEDKPLKYPHMFVSAHVLVLAKTDLLPHLDFDAEECIAYARRVNPALEVLRVSARSGEGMDAWLAWLERGVARARMAAEALDHSHDVAGEHAR